MSDQTISTGRGQGDVDTQAARAASNFHEVGGQSSTVTHDDNAPDFTPTGIDGLCTHDNHSSTAIDPALIGDIRELYRQRVDLHRAEKSLTLQIKAKCRRVMEGDKGEGAKMYKSMLNGQKMPGATEVRLASEPFINARALLNAERLQTEKMLEKLAKQLPVWPWVEAVRGFGPLSLAAIVGEAGDLGNYAGPAKLWKRMGLAVINGGRQRCVSGADAIVHGYSPQRRSMVWNIGECLIKQQGEYREIYLARIVTEVEKAHAEGLDVVTTTAATVESWEKRGLPAPLKVTKSTDQHRTAGHIHNRAKRFAEKRLLRNLWRAWRATA